MQSGNHLPGGRSSRNPSVPRWLWELADRHGYEIREKMGGGGQGPVYRGVWPARRDMVALKTMHYIDAARLLHFQQEFLYAVNVRHRNLVRLYELISDGDDWFFTMELVKGVPFLAYVRSGADDTAASETATWSPPGPQDEEAAHADTPPNGLSPVEEARLRHALRQLAQGVDFLHLAGKIHCDIKHSNVLVTTDGEVKILDYGLIRDLNDEGITQHIQGTFAFMAPEQAEPGFASPASDWYSVGVMLYEALTGRLPFEGDAQRVLFQDKQIRSRCHRATWCPRFPRTSTTCASICSAGCRRTGPPGMRSCDRIDPEYVSASQPRKHFPPAPIRWCARPP